MHCHLYIYGNTSPHRLRARTVLSLRRKAKQKKPLTQRKVNVLKQHLETANSTQVGFKILLNFDVRKRLGGDLDLLGPCHAPGINLKRSSFSICSGTMDPCFSKSRKKKSSCSPVVLICRPLVRSKRKNYFEASKTAHVDNTHHSERLQSLHHKTPLSKYTEVFVGG